MPRMRRVAGNEAVAVPKRGGWYGHEVEGRHRQLRYPDRTGEGPVPAHGHRTLAPWVLKQVLTRATMTVDELRDLS